MKFALIGLGLMGGSLAKDLRHHYPDATLVGVETNPKNAARALELPLVDEICDLPSAVRSAEWVALCIPVDLMEPCLLEILDHLPKDSVTTDFGSTKASLCKAVANHPARARYVAAHPMAGTENSGPDAAVFGLFRDKTTVICEPERSNPLALQKVQAVFKQLGMKIAFMSPAEHDLHAAYISHLSHVISFVLANTVLDKERDTKTIFDLASSGFESTARLGKSSPKMWEAIFRMNRSSVLRAIQAYERHFAEFKDALLEEDHSRLLSLMISANEIRPVLERMRPPTEPLGSTVPDMPLGSGAATKGPDFRESSKKGEDAPAGSKGPLEALRLELDGVDQRLLEALSARNAVVRKIGTLKKQQNLAPLQPGRWESVLSSRVQAASNLGLEHSFTTDLFKLLHEESLRIQTETITPAATDPNAQKK